MALQQFKNLSSWREHSISIQAKSVGELDFKDTFPNMFVVQNPNDCIVYIGISKTPTENSYEFRIGNNSNDCFGRPTGTNKVLFYNSSEKEIFLKVFSVYDSFNLLVLKNMSALIEQATVITDGIVKGFSDTTSLPSGTNTIGKIIPTGEEWLQMVSNILSIESKTMSCDQLQEMLSNMESELIEQKKNLSNIIKNLQKESIIVDGGHRTQSNATIADMLFYDFSSLRWEGVTIDKNKYDYYLNINLLQVNVTNRLDDTPPTLYLKNTLFTFNSDETVLSNVKIHINDLFLTNTTFEIKNFCGNLTINWDIIAIEKGV